MLLVPTLCVGTHGVDAPRRALGKNAFSRLRVTPGISVVGSHAERGNQIEYSIFNSPFSPFA